MLPLLLLLAQVEMVADVGTRGPILTDYYGAKLLLERGLELELSEGRSQVPVWNGAAVLLAERAVVRRSEVASRHRHRHRRRRARSAPLLVSLCCKRHDARRRQRRIRLYS